MRKFLSAAILAGLVAGSFATPTFAGFYTPEGDYINNAGFMVPNSDDQHRQRCRRERVIVYDEFGDPVMRVMNDCPERRLIRYKRPVPPLTHDREISNQGKDSGRDPGRDPGRDQGSKSF